jgi:hypothetical protein
VFIELLDLLRCVNSHEDTWLVASFRSVTNRFMDSGTLGCPQCSTMYLVEKGIGDFTLGAEVPECDAQRLEASHKREEIATRAGAYLNATEPGATIVLGGIWAFAAAELSEMAGVRVIALNAATEVKETERVGLVNVAARIPLAPNSALGVALDAWFPAGIVASAAQVVRPGGRIVGPSGLEPPAGMTILAHDAMYWIAQKAEETIPLRRAGK